MKKKNGFTLIELLVVIALTISILGIAVVSFINVSNRKKEEAWLQIKAQIETAAKEYFVANEYKFEGLSDNVEGYISVGKLVEEDYIGKVTNPITGKAVNSCSLVTVAKKKNKLNATYDDKVSVDDCNGNYIVSIIEPGAPILNTNVECEKSDNSNAWCISDATINVTTDTDAKLTQSSGTFCSGISNNKMTCSSNGTKSFYIEATNGSNKKTRKYVTVKIDKVKPASPTISVSGTPGDNGWYKEKDVSISATTSTCSNVSGCTLKKGTTSISNDSVTAFSNGTSLKNKFLYTQSDTTGTTKYSKVCSGAGLCSNVSSKTVKVDTKKPTLNYMLGYKVYNIAALVWDEPGGFDRIKIRLDDNYKCTSGPCRMLTWTNVAKIKNIELVSVDFEDNFNGNIQIKINYGNDQNRYCNTELPNSNCSVTQPVKGRLNFRFNFPEDLKSETINYVAFYIFGLNKEVKYLNGSGFEVYSRDMKPYKNYKNYIRIRDFKCVDKTSGCPNSSYAENKVEPADKNCARVSNWEVKSKGSFTDGCGAEAYYPRGKIYFRTKDNAGNYSDEYIVDTTNVFN